MLSRFLVAFSLVLAGHCASAAESRLDRLANSYLIENLERDGLWSAKVSNSKIEYTCLQCDGKVYAVVEVVALYPSENKQTFPLRYISEREVLCSNLAENFKGRCVYTDETKMRGGSLKGFVSELEIAGQREIEVVFFYNEKQFGPELIRATVTIEDGATLPDHAIGMFQWHMAKLTIFW